MRFPDTNIFAFTMTDEAPFRALHHQFVTSTLKFERSAFPFKPHCTISSIPVTEEEATRRLRYRWSEAFSLSTLALYGLRGGQVTRLATVSLPC